MISSINISTTRILKTSFIVYNRNATIKKRIHMVPNTLASKNLPNKEIKLYWDLKKSEIKNLAEEIIAHTNKKLESLVNTPLEKADFNSFILPFIRLESWRQIYFSSCMFPQFVSDDPDIRKASQDATQKLQAFEIELGMRDDIYKLFTISFKNTLNLPKEDKRMAEKILLNFKRNGMNLQHKERLNLKSKLTELSLLSSNFQKNISEDNTCVLVKKDELVGLSEDFIESLESVNKNEETSHPILEEAKSSSLRKRVEFAFGARCKENVELLEKAVILRKEISQLLGYKSHAEYILEEKMAKELGNVEIFLEDLRKKLSPIAKKEIKKLLNFKNKVNQDSDGILHSYDITMNKKYKLFKKIKEYFPIQRVTDSMLKLYEKILGLKFNRIENKKCWVEDKSILLYQVDDAKTSEKIGYFYLDLFPREGKCRGRYNNFTRDFVEAPSQWCWNIEILKSLSCHYVSNKPIPNNMIKPLIQAKNHCVGLTYLRQIFFAIFDLKIHKITKGQKGTYPQATFGHMMGGYDAGYYGYLWSQVFSADMFHTKFRDNVTSSNSGDAIDMLKSFLGREPNSEAFISDVLSTETAASKL